MTLGNNEFIKRANIVHNNKYDYSLVEYKTIHKPVKIICHTHGEFTQLPADHLNKNGCQKCGRIIQSKKSSKTKEDFIEQAKKIHNNKYDYGSTKYERSNKRIKILCPMHGEFEQTPETHLYGGGCQKCSSNISKKEILWLDNANVPNTKENRQVRLIIDNKLCKVDGYISETNTIYEFWGDFWHGNLNRFEANDINPKNKLSFGELFNITEHKRKTIINAGYNLIEIWESDWDSQNAKGKLNVKN